MYQTHTYSNLKIDDNKLTCLWSINPNGKLIIFIHGFQLFHNSPTKPWKHFIKYILNDKAFEQYDVIFYSYKSKAEVNVNKFLFSHFLKEISINLKHYLELSNIENQLHRKCDFKFEKIFIVAHSLGALISRWGLVEFHLSNPIYANKCELVLFAPAHNGEKNVSIIESLLSDYSLLFLAKIFKFNYQSINDLDPNSNCIIDLKVEINSLIKRGIKTFTIAIKTIWAKYDKVVKNGNYCSDNKPPMIISNKNHGNLNKPTKSYLDPVNILKKII